MRVRVRGYLLDSHRGVQTLTIPIPLALALALTLTLTCLMATAVSCMSYP